MNQLHPPLSRARGVASAPDRPLVLVVDDDGHMRDALTELLQSVDLESMAFGSTLELLSRGMPDRPGCLLLDVRMPGLSGLDFQRQLLNDGISKPIVFLTAFADIPMTVQAMKAGAVDFFTKPFRDQALLDAVGQAITLDRSHRDRRDEVRLSQSLLAQLTQRERQVFHHVVAGRLNKQIAFDLGISLITVKLHRGNMMRKLRSRSVGELIRLWEMLPADTKKLAS
ncbi:response regulator transcription factor [Ancylobacter amanitiformis]|uniref:FixJ family two-component response regulator n=1 Tax=Ancylobacter amanitiformis TaxID=217069 RepID=A0ABU0LUR3_9HYPH|nr:response regulator transcription factor [Ancylobacter amanitiformis]MDQ0512472.1 FixJ family two-component response regulator [Ancylobacter amanitiformis]